VGKGLKLVNADKQWVKYDGANLAKFNTGKQMTISVWGLAHAFKNPNGRTPGYETVFSKGDGSYVIQKFSMNNKWEACIKAGGHYCAISSKATTQLNQWFHFTMVLDHPSVRFYVNGAADGTSGNGGTWSQGAHPIGIGTQSQYLGENRYWEGLVDEARIMGVSKDIHWIKLDYEIQKEGSTAVTVGKTATRLARRTLPGYLAVQPSGTPRWDLQGRFLAPTRKDRERTAAQRLFFLP
jgi:hypothetical protein